MHFKSECHFNKRCDVVCVCCSRAPLVDTGDTALPSAYLQHDHTDLLHTLDDGQRGPGDGDGSLGGVGQHVSSHLYLSSCRLNTHTPSLYTYTDRDRDFLGFIVNRFIQMFCLHEWVIESFVQPIRSFSNETPSCDVQRLNSAVSLVELFPLAKWSKNSRYCV